MSSASQAPVEALHAKPASQRRALPARSSPLAHPRRAVWVSLRQCRTCWSGSAPQRRSVAAAWPAGAPSSSGSRASIIPTPHHSPQSPAGRALPVR